MISATRMRRPTPRRGSASALIALLVILVSLAIPRSALAWVEVHVAADDIRVQVNRDGSARVEHRIKLKISGAPLKAFDIKGVDGDALPDPDGYVAPLRDASRTSLEDATPVSLELLPPDRRERTIEGETPLPVLRVRFDEEKGLKRGVYLLFIRYKTELAGRGLLKIDGAMGNVRWTSPVWEDGIDSARATFDIPSAPTAPSVDETAGAARDDESAAGPPMFISNVRRGPERDEIELLRTYAPKGEAITWPIRVDARALRAAPPKVESRPSLSLPSSASLGIAEGGRATFVFGGAVGLFLFYSLLVALKAREVTRAAKAAGTEPRPLVPVPIFVRSAGAGLALVSGVALELTMKSGTAGAALVALAAALAAHRTPQWTHASALRGRGRWLPVAAREAFRPPPRPTGAYLDVSTRAGKVFLLFLLACVGGLSAYLMREHPYYAYLVALDATALLAVFCTGRLAELPPDPAAAPARLLGDIGRRVERLMRPDRGEEVRAIGRIRVPDGSPDADELRLGLVPKAPVPGFVGLEVGVVYVPGAGGAIAMPEILLRVTGGSACEAAVMSLAAHGRKVRGRKAEERVIAFTPRLPTARMTASIAAALVRAVLVKAPAAAKSAKGSSMKDRKGKAATVGNAGRERAPSAVSAPSRRAASAASMTPKPAKVSERPAMGAGKEGP